MASDYLAKFMLIGFYGEHQEAGSSDARVQFGEDVFNRYDHHIVDACEVAGIDASVEARSIMAVLATLAPGAAPKTQAGQAVRAYLEYRGL